MAATRPGLKEGLSRGEALLDDMARMQLNGTSHQVELGEWSRVNKDLRQHGLPVVDLAPPHQASKVSDLVLLEPEISRTLRQTLQTLMRDCDRRQELVQELILTNNQLRDELKAQTKVSEKYETKARDLKVMLESSKFQIQELEESVHNTSIHQSGEDEKMRNTKTAIANKYKQVKHKCEMYEQEIDRLRGKVKKMTDEDEKRMMKQSDIIKQLRKKAAKGYVDDKVLDIIDSYERQIYHLKNELELSGGAVQADNKTSDVTDKRSSPPEDGTPNYKALVKTYERQLKDARKKLKDADNESELLRLDLQSRPDLKDFRDAQIRIKSLEKIIKKHHDSQENEALDNKRYSTQVEDLEHLPVHHCRTYLKNICEELAVSDLDDIGPKVKRICKETEAYPRLEVFAKDVLSIVDSSDVPGPPEYGQRPARTKHAIWCDKSSHHVLPTIEYWAMQFKAHTELSNSIERLCTKLMPWKRIRLGENPCTTTLIEAVDSMIYDTDGEEQDMKVLAKKRKGGDGREEPTKEMLVGIVEHFMKLFDVTHVVGVYTRMNDIYTKLGEVYNLLKTLRDLLGLEKNARSGVIVDCVARLCTSHNSHTYDHLRNLLQVEDLDSVVQKLEEHEELFPVFQEIIERLMQILSINKIDQVIPAVKALKMMAAQGDS